MNIIQFCKNCKHSSVKANEHPCQMCMKMGINKYAGKPLAYDSRHFGYKAATVIIDEGNLENP